MFLSLDIGFNGLVRFLNQLRDRQFDLTVQLGLRHGCRPATFCVDQLDPFSCRLNPVRREDRQRLVDRMQERIFELRKLAGNRAIRIRPICRNCRNTRLAVRRRHARQNVIERRAQRIEVRGRILRRPGDIEFMRAVAVFDNMQRRQGPRGPCGFFLGCTKVDQNRVALAIDQNVVGADVPVQHVIRMNVVNRLKTLQQNVFHIARMQLHPRIFDRVQQIPASNEVERHIGGHIVFEDLVDTDDIVVLQFRQPTRLGTEVLHNCVEFRLMLARPRHHIALVTAAHRGRETFLDHDDTVEAVAGEVRHAETTGIQELLNTELAVEKLGTRLQRVSETIAVPLFGLLLPCVHAHPVLNCSTCWGPSDTLFFKGFVSSSRHQPCCDPLGLSAEFANNVAGLRPKKFNPAAFFVLFANDLLGREPFKTPSSRWLGRTSARPNLKGTVDRAGYKVANSATTPWESASKKNGRNSWRQ